MHRYSNFCYKAGDREWALDIMPKQDQKITIIGGSGFVGTNLCHRLAASQIDFEIIDLKMSRQFADKCKIGDVRNIDDMRSLISGDVVINLAAVHRDDVRDKSDYDRTNIDGAANIATACSEKHIQKIIFTSTVAVYGFAKAGTDIHGKINPFNDYGRTKFGAEEQFRKWHKQGGNQLIIVRPTVIFGEGNRGNVYNLLRQVASGRFVMIGDGKNKKSMAYIGNVVAFLESCIADKKDYAVYNYIDGPDLSMNELIGQIKQRLTGSDRIGVRLPYWLGLLLGYCADVVAKISGKNLPVSAVRVRKFTATTSFASNRDELNGFQAPFSLQDGINRTVDSEFINPDPEREIFYTE